MAKKIFTLVLIVCLAAFPAVPQEFNHAREYRECMKLARENSEHSFGRATSWLGLGGGDAAHHCQAVSLVGLGQHEEGARRLEELAQKIRARPSFRAQLFGQAAQAWLLADQPARAEGVLTSALSLDPNNPELFVDRAQAAAAMDAWNRAEEDLKAALNIDPELLDALVFRANARRRLGNFTAAQRDVEAAIRLDPENVEAALESGILHRRAGRKDAARRQWLQVIHRAPGTRAARLAREYLQEIDGPNSPNK
ncbi:MAG: tetratricopeptide repeat protein [Pseudomonadota bacterium]|nr:tetratricopeptide repeat protein [Pseudomonadota bacterium]